MFERQKICSFDSFFNDSNAHKPTEMPNCLWHPAFVVSDNAHHFYHVISDCFYVFESKKLHEDILVHIFDSEDFKIQSSTLSMIFIWEITWMYTVDIFA